MTINEDDPLMHIYQDMFNETTDIDQSDPILNTRQVYRALYYFVIIKLGVRFYLQIPPSS